MYLRQLIHYYSVAEYYRGRDVWVCAPLQEEINRIALPVISCHAQSSEIGLKNRKFVNE